MMIYKSKCKTCSQYFECNSLIRKRCQSCIDNEKNRVRKQCVCEMCEKEFTQWEQYTRHCSPQCVDASRAKDKLERWANAKKPTIKELRDRNAKLNASLRCV